MQDPQSAIMAPHRDFSKCYDDIRTRFNMFAEQRGLSDQINTLLVAEMEAGHFNHSPYIAHMVVNGADIVKNFAAAEYPVLDKLSLDIAHTGIDYYYDFQDHKAKAALESQRSKIADGVIETFKLLGEPRSYIEALAQQKVLLNINPHYFDAYHYEQYQQQRNKLNLAIERFSDINQRNMFVMILQEHEKIAQHHDKYFQAMDKFKQVQDNSLKILNRIDQTIPHKAQVDTLIKQLQEHGIEINDKLFTLIYQNEEIRTDLGKVLEYIDNENQAKLLQAQQQTKNANYQGLSDACHFVSELGRVTGSRELSVIGGIAQASVQIHRSVDQIMNASMSGFAIMGPYAAIGMAVLGVFSLFKRSSDPNKMIMKQLMKISKQITALHKDMSQHFQHLDEKLNYIFQKIMETFESLQLNLNISVSSKISEIQSQLETLTRICQIAFEEMLLKDLKSLVAYMGDIREGMSKLPTSQENYEEKLRIIREFILEKSCSPLLNGTVYKDLLLPNPGHTKQMMGLLKTRDFSNLQNLLGLLVHFAKSDLKISEFQSINERQIFHPRLWQIALETYLEFKKLNDNKFEYDTKGVNLQKFSEHLHHYLKFIYQIQTNKSLYQKLFDEIKSCQNQLQIDLTAIIKTNGGTIITTRPIEYELPDKLRDQESVKMTQTYFSNLKGILQKAAITIPPKFHEAEQLGLGYIEIRMHMPKSLHNRSTRKHRHKYKCSKGDTAGLEINFYLAGQKLPLYKAGIVKEELKKYRLDGMYGKLIADCKTTSPEIKRSEQLIEQAIKQHTSTSKTQSAQRIASYLTDSASYHRLLKLNHLLLAYLTCAGLTAEQIKPLEDNLLLIDLINVYENCAKNPANKEMPAIQFCSPELLSQNCVAVLNHLNDMGSALQLSPELLSLQDLLLQLPKLNTAIPSSQFHGSFFPPADRPSSAAPPVTKQVAKPADTTPPVAKQSPDDHNKRNKKSK